MFQSEFSNFLDLHLMWSLGIPLGLVDSFVPLVIPVLSTEKVGYALPEVGLGGLLNEG